MPVPHRRRGMMLVVTLVIVTLLALLGASFAFRMNADVAAVSAQHDLQQARQAAESGIDRAIMVLREYRTDMDQWYNNPKSFRRILVWSPDKIGGSESVADQEKVAGRPAWRFSIISYRLDGDDAKIRYGVSDEAGKININTASRSQLIALFDSVKHDDNVTSIDLADAILHWRGDEGVPDETAAKLTDFYKKQNPSYKPKQRPFETVEELLMVKGFDGQLVYGEDYNRNGYLDPNEDDGQDGAFPPDDGDSKLHRGLLPLVTCYSWDRNASNDNRQRININMANLAEPAAGEETGVLPGMSVRELLSKEIRPEVLDFIAEARKRNFKFRSVGEIVGLEVYQDGSSNYDRQWRRFLRELNQADRARAGDDSDDQGTEEGGREGDRDRDGGGRDTGGERDAGGDDSGDRGRDLGPRRDNTRTSEDRRREQEEKDKDKDDSDGGSGRSDAGSGGATIVLAGFAPGGAEIIPSVIPSVLLAGVDEPVAGDKDARKLQSARGSSRGSSSGSSGSGRSGSSRGGSSGRSGGRSFGLGDDDDKDTNNGTGSDSSGGSGRGRGSGGRGSGTGSSRGGDSAGGSGGDSDDDDSGGRRSGGRRGGSASDDGGSTRGSGRDSDRDGDASSGDDRDSGSGGRGRGREGGRRGGEEGERRGGERGREGGEDGDTTGDNSVGEGENEPRQENNGAGGGTGGAGGRGTPLDNPVTLDDLPALMDRLTTLPMPVIAGQINVNTAPVEVLRTLPGVGEAEAEAIVAKRAQLSGLDKITPAWLVTSGALPAEQFALISNLLTARSLQYTVESIGFADHVGAAKRIQAVVEFKGQMAQIKYYRDITSLGIGYPVHDDERSQGFAFSDR